LAEIKKRAAAGYLGGVQATIIGIKANEAVLSVTRGTEAGNVRIGLD